MDGSSHIGNTSRGVESSSAVVVPYVTHIGDSREPSSNVQQDLVGPNTPAPGSNEFSLSESRLRAIHGQRKGRKGHTKSRRGCFNCKRARIKCKENRPSCDYCAHRGLICEWPAVRSDPPEAQTQLVQNSPSLVSSSVPQPFQNDIPVFTLQDFRFFQHFVSTKHSHDTPIGNRSVWKHEIPILSSDHPYLLHAVLALAAFDIAEKHAESYQQLFNTAISYRVRAISALKAATASGLATSQQGNAMIATCFALVFQSVLIEDGLLEYMTFVRGTIVVGIKMGMKRMPLIFDRLFEDKDIEKIDPAMKRAPLIEPVIVRGALRSLGRLEGICRTKVERDVFRMLLTTVKALVNSSRDAYMDLRKIYGAFAFTMPNKDFQELLKPSNQTCRVLLAHFVALQLIMTPVTRCEWAPAGDTKIYKKEGQTVRWFRPFHRNITEDMKEYYEWTLWVENEVKQNRVFNGILEEKAEELSDTKGKRGAWHHSTLLSLVQQ